MIMCMQVTKIFDCGKFRDQISNIVLENEEAFYECKAPFLSVIPDEFKKQLKRREEILNNVLDLKTLRGDFMDRLFKNED